MVGPPLDSDAEVFRRFFASTFERGLFARVVVVTSMPADPRFALPDVPSVELDLVASREFTASGARVDLYRPRPLQTGFRETQPAGSARSAGTPAVRSVFE
jgi:hypothetical protein